jgi:hypothetical protein
MTPLRPARGVPAPTCARAQVPHTLASDSWETAEAPYVQHLLSICDRFAPGTSELVRAAPRPRRALCPPSLHARRPCSLPVLSARGACYSEVHALIKAYLKIPDGRRVGYSQPLCITCVPCSFLGIFDAPQTHSACKACSALHQVADTFTLTPPKIASHFGITAGHIHHIDNSFGFDERFPCATPVLGLYSASAGARGAVCSRVAWQTLCGLLLNAVVLP